MPKLHYITERAHGLQIMQNCEAFAAAGYNVTLWVSRRWNTPQMRRITDPYAYYGVERNFRIRRLPCLDFFPLFPAESAGARLAFYLLTLSYALAMFFALPFVRADVFYSRDELLLALLSWLKPKRSLAYEAHLFPSSGRGAALQRTVCQGVGSVIAITPQLRDDLVEMRNADARRIISAHDGIRRARFETLPDTIEARRRLGWDENAFIVGYVGSLKMIGLDKGVGALLAAVANVEGARLALVGGQSADALALKRQWTELGLPDERFFHLGHVPPGDVPLCLCAFDVCAMPHPATTQFARYTSPLKLFEYMASACAIVASDLPGWSDVLRDGETALLVPPDNVAAWSAAICALQRDSELRRKLGDNAREQVMANYTWTVRAKRILAHLEAGFA